MHKGELSMNMQPAKTLQVMQQGLRLYRITRKNMWPLSIIVTLLYLSCWWINPVLRPGIFIWAIVIVSLINIYFATCMLMQAEAVIAGRVMSGQQILMESLKLYPVSLIAGMMYLVASYIGIFLFIFPGIFLMVLFIFFLSAVITTDKTPFAVMAYSKELVWKNWWRTFIVMLMPCLMITIIMALFMFVVRMFDHLISIRQASIAHDIFYYGVIWLAVSFVLPLFFTTLQAQYHDLVLRLQQKGKQA